MSDTTNDPHQLTRFIEAQRASYTRALAELRAGAKHSHFMWFIFPQLAGLGRSETALFYGIRSRAEAEAYWAHPILGPRLRECVEALLSVTGKSAYEILGTPDDLKLRSSLTLFAEVAGQAGNVFRRGLDRFFDGKPDPRTVELLARR